MFGALGVDGTHVLSHAEVPRPTEAVNASFLIQITKENTAIMMGLPGTSPEYVEEHLVQVGDDQGSHFLQLKFYTKIAYFYNNILYLIVDGVWDGWSQWQDCPVTCGGGDQERSRTCNFSDPSNKGLYCQHDGSSGSQTQRCGEASCPGKKNCIVISSDD